MPSPTQEEPNRGEEGSASVELVGVLPFLLLAILVAAQLAFAGQALWSAAIAARAGARAGLVGGAGAAAARAALPPPMREGARVEDRHGFSASVPVPRVLPGMPSFRVSAGTNLGSSGG